MRCENYVVDDDADRIDVDIVHSFLSKQAPWAANIPRETVVRSLRTSLCLGAYTTGGAQVGFVRVVTDNATFAWICDVFVLPEHRGCGLGDRLVRAAIEHPRVAGVRRVLLATTDAHGLYSRWGFSPVPDHQFMEICRAPRQLWPESTEVTSIRANGH
ncbi:MULTISPECIES: GNAT family N-acetyltransferase [Streptosporangium]|uniref:GNAT superfamily N-acetyltransferase n=1 Tax=Streptosporangium brasiliense TaxID=47480 RepID=A0ABT9RIB4_9ACTN|nr:GNAT family N-acetyltransferase [Streptosporangium brasiliense]MDP9869039.1 GNAT superfamily N-acetyltransferase [Streptosporangium brasiliense]